MPEFTITCEEQYSVTYKIEAETELEVIHKWLVLGLKDAFTYALEETHERRIDGETF